MLPLDLASFRSSVNRVCTWPFPRKFQNDSPMPSSRADWGPRPCVRSKGKLQIDTHISASVILHVSGVPAPTPWLRFLLKSLLNLNSLSVRLLLHGLPPPPQWSGQWSRTLQRQILTHQCKTRGWIKEHACPYRSVVPCRCN